MNLHGIVRGAISAVHADEVVTHYRARSFSADEYETDDEGNIIHGFEVTKDLKAQIQTESDSALYYSDHVSQNDVVRRCYLFAPKDKEKRAFSLYRPLARSGDYLKRSDGTLWLVSAVLEDFGDSGWVSLRITLQVKPPPEIVALNEEENE